MIPLSLYQHPEAIPPSPIAILFFNIIQAYFNSFLYLRGQSTKHTKKRSRAFPSSSLNQFFSNFSFRYSLVVAMWKSPTKYTIRKIFGKSSLCHRRSPFSSHRNICLVFGCHHPSHWHLAHSQTGTWASRPMDSRRWGSDISGWSCCLHRHLHRYTDFTFTEKRRGHGISYPVILFAHIHELVYIHTFGLAPKCR